MPEPLVSATGVSRDYVVNGVTTHAVRESSFTVNAGELVALTGPSGSGKTTLLHLMAGLDTPSVGEISWPGIGKRHELRPLHVTIAFQGPSLLPALDVAENVALPLVLGGLSDAQAADRAAEILERMELTEFSDKLPEELSGGQSQRVALARALVVEPVLLIADEPTGQQDRTHADRLLDFLLEHAERSRTALVIATHDAAVASRFVHRWMLADGVLSPGDGV
jgi:ABC-type lipoprotein export system ATPase subunit